jgi:hypothetical protein
VFVNCVPDGHEVKDTLVRWALEAYAGVIDRDPEPLDVDPSELAPYVGTYATDAVRMDATVSGNRLDIAVTFTPGGGEPPSSETFRVGMFDVDRFVVVAGPYKGLTGSFVRDGDEIAALAHIGRLAPRVLRAAPAVS